MRRPRCPGRATMSEDRQQLQEIELSVIVLGTLFGIALIAGILGQLL